MYLCLLVYLILLHADTGDYETYFPDILGGGWKLVRRVRKGGRWHPATDQLRGTEMYGIFADNPQVDRTFSRRFDTEAFDQFLFITGDEELWLVADKGDVMAFYDNQPRQIIASSISRNPYEAKWKRRHGKDEDPTISMVDYEEARDRGKILYLENKYEDADILEIHNGANVFIRHRDYKVYVSGYGNFELQAPIQERGRVWYDRNYRWNSYPDFLEGGIIVHGPYEKLKQGEQLDIRVTYPSTVFVMVVELPDRRNGGFLKSLPQQGWELMKLKALWSKNKFYIFRKSVEDVERLPKFETGQTVMSVVAKRQFVNVGKSQCISEIGQNPCFFHKEGVSLHDCQAGCLLYEECLGWSDIGGKHCHLFFTETSGVVVRKDLAEGWKWGTDSCGGMTIVKSSEHSKTYSCFKKKDRKDLLTVKVSGCCKFGPNVPVAPYSKIWNDEKFQFRHGLPRYLIGATLVRGPQQKISMDTFLKVEVSRPSMVYVLVNTDKRNGGWRTNLPRDGWTKLDEVVRWHQEMEIYAKPVNKEISLPRTRTERTIMAIIAKPSLTESGNLLCYAGYVDEKYLRQPKPYAYTDKFPTRESCRYHCLVKFQSQGYSYYTSGNYNECRCGRTGTSMEELMTDSNQELDRRRPCLANDKSVMEWCTCETTTVSYLEKSCYGADETGLFTLRSANIPVYCDMDYEGGKWLLLLTQKSATDQYPGSVSPLATEKYSYRPNPKRAYSRDWRTSGIEPKEGDEFLIRRGISGDSVRFVVDKWCGWGDKMINCETGKNVHHPFLATGEAFDQNGKKLPNIKYFNGCAYGGGCGKKGVDGIGFGSLENHLRSTYGDRGYGGTGFPGAMRWNKADEDSGDNLPYTYWYRPAKSKGEGELARQVSKRLQKEATKEKTYKEFVHMCRADHADKVSQLAFEKMRKDRDNFENKWDHCTHDKHMLERFWKKKNEARMKFWKGKIRDRNAKCDQRMRRAKKKFRLKRTYLAGRLKDEVQGASQHFTRYQKRIEDLKHEVKQHVLKYDDARSNTHKWMKRYFALKRRMRLADAKREKDARDANDTLLKKLDEKEKGPSMDDLLQEEKQEREGIDTMGQKYLKGRSKSLKDADKLAENFREEADKEKRDNIRSEYDAKLTEKLAKEKAKRLEKDLTNVKLEEDNEKSLIKSIQDDDEEDDSVQDDNVDSSDSEKKAQREIRDAVKDVKQLENVQLDKQRRGHVSTSLHYKIWHSNLDEDGNEKTVSSQNEPRVDVSPDDLGNDISLDDLDEEETAMLEKRIREENAETNRKLQALGGNPIELEDMSVRRLLKTERRYDERGVESESSVGTVTPVAAPKVQYVPVTVPLSIAAARGYPIPQRAYYQPIGTRVMKQKPLAATKKSAKKQKPHLKGDGMSKRHRKHKKEHKKPKKADGGGHSSVVEITKKIEDGTKDLNKKKKQSLETSHDDGTKKKGPKAEKSGKIFKKDDVIENPEKSEHDDENTKSHNTHKERAVNTKKKVTKEKKSSKSRKGTTKLVVSESGTPMDDSHKADSSTDDSSPDDSPVDDSKTDDSKHVKKKKTRRSRKKKKSKESEYGGFSVEELQKLSAEDDVEGKFLEQHHKLVLSNKDRDLCERTKSIVDHRVKKLTLNLGQCVQKYERVEQYHKSKLQIEKDIQQEISSNCEKAKKDLKNLWRRKYNEQGKLLQGREEQFQKQLKLALEKNSGESTLKGKLAGCEEDASMARQETRRAKQEVEETKKKMADMENYAQKRIRQLKNLHKSCDKRGAMELVAENERIKEKYRQYKEQKLSWKKERHMYKAVIDDLKAQLKKLMKEEYSETKEIDKNQNKYDDELFGENLDDETKDIDRTKLRYSRTSASRGAFDEEMKKKEAEEKKKKKDVKSLNEEGAEDEDEIEMSVYYKPKKTTTTEEPSDDENKDVVSDKKSDDSNSKASSDSDKYRGEDRDTDARARKQMELDEKKRLQKEATQVNYDDDERPTKGHADDDEEEGNTQIAVASEDSKDALIEQVEAVLKSANIGSKRYSSMNEDEESGDEYLEQGDSIDAEEDLGKKIADAGDPLKDVGDEVNDSSVAVARNDEPSEVVADDSPIAATEPKEPLTQKEHLEKPMNEDGPEISADYDEVDLNEPSKEELHERAIDFGPESHPSEDDDELDLNNQNLDDTEPNEVLHPERYDSPSESESEALRRLLRQ